MIKPFYISTDKSYYLLHGDTFELLPKFEHKFDMIFADPPYFLSPVLCGIFNIKL